MDPATPPPPPPPPPRQHPQPTLPRLQFSVRTLLIVTAVLAILLTFASLVGWDGGVALLLVLVAHITLVVLLIQGAVYAHGATRQFCRGALVGTAVLVLQAIPLYRSLLLTLILLVSSPLIGGFAALLANRIWPATSRTLTGTAPSGPPERSEQ